MIRARRRQSRQCVMGSDLSHLAISSIVKFIQEMRRKSLAYTMVGPLFRAQPSLDVLTACRRDNA